jgi:predicted NBD/HSP70 family sugar kinase
MEEVNLKQIIRDKFDFEIEVDNDAKCAGLAELLFGYGKNINTLFS